MRAIDAVLRTGSISVAAQKVGLTQPAITSSIKGLEKGFGAQLFRRDGHTFYPTPLLEKLIPKLRLALQAVDEMERELMDTGELVGGHLSLSYSNYEVALPSISEFVKLYPSVTLNARNESSSRVLRALETGDIQIGFLTAKELPPSLQGYRILETLVVLAAPCNHPIAKKGTVRWSEIEKLRLIQLSAEAGTRKLFESEARSADCTLTTAITVGSWAAVADMVRAGIGIGVCQKADLTDADGLVPVTIAGAALDVNYFLAHKKEMLNYSNVKKFVDVFLQTLTAADP